MIFFSYFCPMEMLNRYIPQMRLPEVGEEGQKRLAASSVLIVGCGALGSPIAMYLAGAGVGHIHLADFDTVSLSNLHRQIFFSESQTCLSKVNCLKERILALNSGVDVEVSECLVSRKFLDSLNRKFNMIVDAADNPATTYLLSDFCRDTATPLSSAGVSGWTAQVFTYVPGSFTFRDVVPFPDDSQGVLPCSVTGIVGPTSAFAASLQCSEVLKSLLGIADNKSRLVSANLLDLNFNTF